MAADGLFAAPEPVPDPLDGLSPDARRTARQRMAIADGIHPLTRRPLLTGDMTCGDCVHRVLVSYHNKTYGKCDQMPLKHSAANDCRRSWPACNLFEAAT